MNIILYLSKKETEAGARLINKISSNFYYENIEVFDHMDNFKKRIHSFPRKIDVAVILTVDSTQLSDILEIKEALEDMEIILILPDQDKDTVSKGMTLYPRFLAYTDSDFDDVSAVLGKLGSRRIAENTSLNRNMA